MAATVSPAVIRRTENWLIRRGMPLLIADYSFSSHVLPRMVPFLALVSATGLLWPLREELSPVGRFVAVAAVLVGGVAAGILLNRFRRLPVFPRRAVILVLVTYGAMPLLIPLLDLAVSRTVASPDVGAGQITEGRTGFLWAVVGFGVIFGVLFEAARLTTLYGILPLLARSVRNAWQDLRNTLRLQSRALPMLLFVTLFFFFTGELWQAMNRLTWWRLVLVLALFAGVTVLAAAGRLREEIGRVENDLQPPKLTEACRGTPLEEVSVDDLAPIEPPPLADRQIGSLLVMLASRQLVQAIVVGLWLFAFFVVLGLLVVDGATAEQWIGEPPRPLAMFPNVPVALPRNAVLLAGFGSMYFAVTSMFDTENRRRFFTPILDEVERTLAVRAVYLAARGKRG
ncbi:hypothetical protein [Virgisporangium aurantiacum]|uniref:Uncharacterized protein n=1 Tax=Virgisporangium aurantiacum TaxID=175570 RepID=A0A8J3ZDD3_9ACTN|nr:hypothetical protein [Virgisporangium aurantiacum]GIJ60738.1 hypothetical protein Vau01_082540 [Virgisporangium aurantiacum]